MKDDDTRRLDMTPKLPPFDPTEFLAPVTGAPQVKPTGKLGAVLSGVFGSVFAVLVIALLVSGCVKVIVWMWS